MKEKINRYARGVFEFDPQKVVTDENNIFAIVDKNKEFKGTFCIYEEKEGNSKVWYTVATTG